MTDTEALDILAMRGAYKNRPAPTEKFLDAVVHATKRLEECQWRDYDPETFGRDYRVTFGSKMILGIRYDDGSKGSVAGFVMYSMEKGYYLVIDVKDANIYTENAVIEKYMKYPDYN